ncbi:hypothetical protein KSS87_002046, partial [Heliosperma pusillum]
IFVFCYCLRLSFYSLPHCIVCIFSLEFHQSEMSRLLLRLISHNLNITHQNPNPLFLGFFINPNRSYNTSATHQSTPPPPLSDKITAIADEISNLTLMEVADLTALLGKKLEVKDMPMVSLMMPGMSFSLRGMGAGAAAATGGADAAVEKMEAKTSFDLKLEAGFETGAKIKIIKELRTFTELGLKEAKDLVEKAPAVLKTGVPKEEAEKIVEKMKAIGAKVIME